MGNRAEEVRNGAVVIGSLRADVLPIFLGLTNQLIDHKIHDRRILRHQAL